MRNAASGSRHPEPIDPGAGRGQAATVPLEPSEEPPVGGLTSEVFEGGGVLEDRPHPLSSSRWSSPS